MDRHGPPDHAGKGAAPAAPEAADLEAADFAEYLRAERERRQLTLEQVADETKIAPRHLAALERGDVRNWPGGMYRRAMMRAYAESIGVDREFALKQFEQVFPPPQPMEAPAPPPERPARAVRWRPSHRQMLGASASILAIAAFAIVWKVAAGLTSGAAEAVDSPLAAVASAATEAPKSTPAPPPSAAPQPAAPSSAAPAVPAATTGSQPVRPLATEGALVVESDPPGARVTVNGVGWGETPLTVRHLEFGSKRIRLTLQDHMSEERGVSLGPERPNARVRIQLRQR